MNQTSYAALLISIIVVVVLGLFSILRIEETRSSVVRLEPGILALSTALEEVKNQNIELSEELEGQRNQINDLTETTQDSLSQNQEAIESLGSLVTSEDRDPIPDWREGTTIEEGKRLFADCLANRAGLFGEVMASNLNEPGELWDSMNVESPFDELTGIKLMGTMFGCWK